VRALVTGAGGFCGRHLVRHLEGQAVEVHTLSAGPTGAGVHHVADPLDAEALAAVLRRARPDYLLHLAGVSRAVDVATFYRVNTLYAASLLDAVRAAGLGDRPMLLVGTAAEYGSVSPAALPIGEDTPPRPLGHYGASKLAQTQMAQAAARQGRPLVVARPANIIGPGMPDHLAAQSFMRQAVEVASGIRDPVIDVGDLDAVRDFIDVDDVVTIYWRLLQEPRAQGQVVNVCTGEGMRVGDLLSRAMRIAGVTAEIRRAPDRGGTDVPVHVGSAARLRGLLGPIAFTPLDVALGKLHQALLATARSPRCAR